MSKAVIILAVNILMVMSLGTVKGQTAIDYLFLEVIDSAGKPVADASVETLGYRESGRTNDKGQLHRGVRAYRGDFNTSGIKVAKPGYFPFEDLGIFSGYFGGWDFNDPIRIELLKIPATRAERRVVGKEQLKREFMAAVRNSDIDSVRKLLKSGIDPDISTNDLRGIPGPKSVAAITLAAISGSGEVIKELLRAGARVREGDGSLEGTLTYYISSRQGYSKATTEEAKAKWTRDHAEGFAALMGAGVDLRAPGLYGQTPLMAAALGGSLDFVKMLRARGVPVNVRDTSGHTVLMYLAAQDNRLEMTRLLLASGANPNIIGRDCESALGNAAAYGRVDIIRLLIANKAKVNLHCEAGASPLIKAARANSAESVRLLLNAGADLSGGTGERALEYARQRRSRGTADEKRETEKIIISLEGAGVN